MPIGKPIKKVSNVTVINPDTGEVVEDQDILIDGDRIGGIEQAGDSKVKDGIDGEGLFAIPGLIDTHVHSLGLFTEKMPGPLDIGWVARQQLKNLAYFLRGGVTTIRDMAAPINLIRFFSGRAEGFAIKSPRIIYAGPMLTVRGGYPYFVPEDPVLLERIMGAVRVPLRNNTHARRTVDRLAARGVNCIKAGFQSEKYDDERSPIPLMPLDRLRAIIDRARERGVPVAVHHVYRKDLQKILDLPFDSLEHVTIDEVLSDEEVERIARKKIPVSATFMAYGIIDYLDRLEHLLLNEPERFEKEPGRFLAHACKSIRDGKSATRFIGMKCIKRGSTVMRKNLKLLFDAGVPIVNGTDSGGAITPTGCPHWELIDMVRAGLSPLDALRTATTTASRVINRPGLGVLEPGATADVVLLRANPLENIEAVGDVAAVVRDGRLVHKD